MKNRMKNISDVDKYVQKVWGIFFLWGWDLTLLHPKNDKGEVAAECSPCERYRTIDLTFYPLFWNHSRRDQEGIIIHELCHVITGIQNGLVNALMDGSLVTKTESGEAYERETSWMANIIDRLLHK